MKYLFIFALVIGFASCKKDETKCFICTIGQKDSTTVFGGGRVISSEKQCNLTQKEADAMNKTVDLGNGVSRTTLCLESD